MRITSSPVNAGNESSKQTSFLSNWRPIRVKELWAPDVLPLFVVLFMCNLSSPNVACLFSLLFLMEKTWLALGRKLSHMNQWHHALIPVVTGRKGKPFWWNGSPAVKNLCCKRGCQKWSLIHGTSNLSINQADFFRNLHSFEPRESNQFCCHTLTRAYTRSTWLHYGQF